MPAETEGFEGYVVDIACLRRFPERERFERAREHTKECALMGHCIESGYGVVDETGRLHLLDTEGTARVESAVRATDRERGIRVRVRRRAEDGEMKTVMVEEI